MKVLACPVCGEEKEVDDSVDKVICAECLITGEAPLSEDGVQRYSPEAFLKLVSVGIDDWKDPKSEEVEEKKLVRKFNNLREKKIPLINVQERMDISWKKTKKLEAYRLLQKGWTQNKIAKELKVNQATVSRWYMHFTSTSDIFI